ncbi:MAG: hypothetical protein GX774_02515 [Armatimonadetes bacterium]|nr:hypothetical protein [Armatimonadota bacterium]
MSNMLAGIVALTACAALAHPAQAEPRAAIVYSAWANYGFRDTLNPVFGELGWPVDHYENVRLAELFPRLSDYTVVVLDGCYNYANPQDLRRDAPAWRRYVAEGGCLLAGDANYPQQYEWLAALDARLRWACSGKPTGRETETAPWIASDHPLMAGVPAPALSWTQPVVWSRALTPLVLDPDGRPMVASLAIGKGLVIVASLYSQQGWPGIRFLRNLVSWVRDPARLAALPAEPAESATPVAPARPELHVPMLSTAPVLDGVIDSREWAEAAVLTSFASVSGAAPRQRTVCRVAQGPDDLYVAFECHDEAGADAPQTATAHDDALWVDDCVEVFLDPGGKGERCHVFAVNATGTRAEALGPDRSWDGYWAARTSRGPDGWRAEIRIPFTSLGISAATPPASTWLANFCRTRRDRAGIGREATAWAPNGGMFNDPAGFGVLQGVRVDADRYPLQPLLTVEAPARWQPGNNRVQLTPAVAARQGARVRVACVDARTGEEVLLPGVKRVRPGATAAIRCRLALAPGEVRFCQYVLRDAEEPGRVLASGPVLRVAPVPLLETQVLMPAFRGLVQSRDPRKLLWVRGRANTDATRLVARLTVTVAGEARRVGEASARVRAGRAFELQVPLETLPPGEYSARLVLTAGDRQLAAETLPPVRVLPPAAMEVTFDHRRVCYANGQPFFPIGLYHTYGASLDRINARAQEVGLPAVGIEETLKSLKEHGFNVAFHTWGMPDEADLEVAQKLGLYVLPEVGAPDDATLERYVALANRFNNVLMWYGIDEPSGERLQRAMDAHARYARLDPHRPVSAAINQPRLAADALRAYDLLMMDPYFIRHAPLSGIADWIDEGLAAGKGLAPIWMVPQAFTVDGSPWSEPTPAELRCQAYLCLARGATGLVWYAYWSPEPYAANPRGLNYWFLPDSPLWEAFRDLNAEIATVAPVILEGEALGPARCDQAALITQVWRHRGKQVLIAVNPTDQPVEATFTGLAGKSVEVLFEGRRQPIERGRLRDTFAPLAAHVYR